MAPHILVIDDQANLARFIRLELLAEGYQVSIQCDNLTELSTNLPSLKPDLILLNWELRSASGSDICRQLKLDHHQAPIVLVTVEDQWCCQSVLDLGAQGCLAKPFSMETLLATIRHHLDRVSVTQLT
jgi:DNA-binding response OmpR family regulator